jgi:Zn-dependent M28 family amino/carboxypeptidase
VRWLAETIGSRPAGSPAERRAAAGLAEKLAALGYTTQLQPFPVRRFDDRGARVAFVEEPSRTVQAAVLQYSAGGTVRGRLVSVGLGQPADLAQRDLRGAVALLQRGELTFGDKVRHAAAAGAVAAIIYNNQAGLFEGTLGAPAPIPAVAISAADGHALIERLAAGPLTVELTVDASIIETTSQNVVATLPGSSDRVIVLGGHYDSVPAGPGANDNASGTATALELARVLRERPLPFTVRIVLFGAEEIGLVGSRAYVQALSPAERERTVAMLNFDMVGVGDRLTVSGSVDLVGLAIETARRIGAPVDGTSGGRVGRGSDHASFMEVGIPALFFYRGEDPRYHSPEDRAEYVEPQHLAAAGRLALELLARLAGRS